jgi:Tol biopolymer transport system component
VRPDGTHRRRLMRLRGPEFDPSWSPDGRRLAFRDSRRGINENDEIYVMDADGSRLKDLLHSGQRLVTRMVAGRQRSPTDYPEGAKREDS